MTDVVWELSFGLTQVSGAAENRAVVSISRHGGAASICRQLINTRVSLITAPSCPHSHNTSRDGEGTGNVCRDSGIYAHVYTQNTLDLSLPVL